VGCPHRCKCIEVSGGTLCLIRDTHTLMDNFPEFVKIPGMNILNLLLHSILWRAARKRKCECLYNEPGATIRWLLLSLSARIQWGRWQRCYWTFLQHDAQYRNDNADDEKGNSSKYKQARSDRA